MNPIPTIPMLNGSSSGKTFLVIGILVSLVIAAKRKPLQAK
jgi:hypothetical protein